MAGWSAVGHLSISRKSLAVDTTWPSLKRRFVIVIWTLAYSQRSWECLAVYYWKVIPAWEGRWGGIYVTEMCLGGCNESTHLNDRNRQTTEPREQYPLLISPDILIGSYYRIGQLLASEIFSHTMATPCHPCSNGWLGTTNTTGTWGSPGQVDPGGPWRAWTPSPGQPLTANLSLHPC